MIQKYMRLQGQFFWFDNKIESIKKRALHFLLFHGKKDLSQFQTFWLHKKFSL